MNREIMLMDGVAKSYKGKNGTVAVFGDVNLRLERGAFVALQGASGCGKTTLLLIAGALLEPDRGRVELEGRDLYAMNEKERAKLRSHTIGFVFQQFHLIPYLTVFENVLAASLGNGGGKAVKRAGELIDHFGLRHRLHHFPAELSMGEKQRTALARALLNEPSILLADEPTGNLDEDNSDIVLRHVQEFASGGGAVFLVTHDQRAAKYAQTLYTLHEGALTNQLEQQFA